MPIQPDHLRAAVLRGNALALPVADDSVDLVVTSPPYFALRSYQDAGEHYDGQIGSEATPAEFVDALIAATREIVRVLKPSGSIWINLGDKYARTGGGGGGSSDGKTGRNGTKKRPPASYTPASEPSIREELDHRSVRPATRAIGAPEKSLIGIPWRYALRCIDDLGLILRAEVIWSKPNGLPESVTDRVRRSHETWFHFTLNPRYYSAVDEIREPHLGDRAQAKPRPNGRSLEPRGPSDLATIVTQPNPLGKLPGSVWEIATEPLKVPAELGVDHFAAFPTEWPRRIIQGWSPAGVCVECGEGRRPVSVNDPIPGWVRGTAGSRQASTPGGARGEQPGQRVTVGSRVTITGYACACPEPTAPTTPAVVLDPFGGTGTTALVAKALGRRGISVDMSADYCRLATWRTNDPDQIAKAMRVDKPIKQAEGQLSMLDLLDNETE